MAAPDWMLDSTAAALAAILPHLRRTPGPVADTAVYARTRRTLERLLADTRAATRSTTLAADLAEIVTGYRQASDDMRAVIAGLERVIVATRAAAVVIPARTATQRLQQQHELALYGLIEALACAEIGQAVARLDLPSHDEARALRLRLGRTLEIAVERAAERGAEDVLLGLRALAAALVRDLIERGRPLARIVAYETGLPLPAVVLAHALYQDAGRAGELTAENAGHDHPGFMPMRGKARSR